MKHIEINIGKACNNKCRFCMSSKVYLNEKYLTSLVLIKKEIDNYAEKGYKSIGFLGGDISIHPNLYEIISYCKEKEFKSINVITNGMIFEDYEKAKRLVESGVMRVNVSVHSHKKEIEDYLTQVKGGLKRKLKAIDNFNSLYKDGYLKNPLSINFVLNGRNYKSIVETILYFWKVKGINDIRINFIWPRYFYSEKDKEELVLSYADFLPYLRKLVYVSLKYNIRLTFDTVPICIFYKISKLNFRKLIKKFLGEQFDYINEICNINQSRIISWKEHKKNDLKIKVNQCEKCIYNKICDGVWKEYVDIYGGNEFIPIIK